MNTEPGTSTEPELFKGKRYVVYILEAPMPYYGDLHSITEHEYVFEGKDGKRTIIPKGKYVIMEAKDK